MRNVIGMILFWLGMLLRWVGGLACVVAFIAGVIAVFRTSLGFGLMIIGGAVVGAWILQIASMMILGAGLAVMTVGVKDNE
jgi:hypothetical protein